MSESTPKEYALGLELYEKLVASSPKVRRQGVTVPYTSLNGHMFSYFGKVGELALRLPTALARFISTFGQMKL
jgi:hypothetical protein